MSQSPSPLLLNEPRKSRRVATRVLVVLCIAIAVGLGAAVMTYRHIDETIRDSYAVWWVAGMVNTYMDENEGRWPKDWEDLKEPYRIETTKAGHPWTFEELRGRVDVDFSANPDELAKAVLTDGEVPFRVVYLRNGKEHHWESAEPNRLIWDHLQKRAEKAAAGPSRVFAE